MKCIKTETKQTTRIKKDETLDDAVEKVRYTYTFSNHEGTEKRTVARESPLDIVVGDVFTAESFVKAIAKGPQD